MCTRYMTSIFRYSCR